jgi:perosamine synthetase
MIPLWKPFKEEFEGLSQGEATEQLERELANFLGVNYAVAVSNGTAALFLALKAIGMGETNRVLVSDLTHISEANAVSLTGATPIFGDVDDNLCLDFGSMNEMVDAVIVTHFNGREARIPKDVMVIEDACHALGGTNVQGLKLGSLGDCGCFSFSPTKTVYAGQGGVVVTNHRWLYENVVMLRDQGRRCKGENYLVKGFNFKFTDLQAKIALKQVHILPEILDRKREVYSRYFEELENIMIEPKENEVIWLPDIYVKDRCKVRRELSKQGIDSRVLYSPLHIQVPYFDAKDYPRAELASERGLWLPSNPSDEEIAYICKTVKDVLR